MEKNLRVRLAFSNMMLYTAGEVMDVYAERIRLLRQKKGLSRQALADRMGVSATAVYKWENGQSQPNIDMLEKLANLFGVTLDELCDRRMETAEADATMVNISVMTRALRQLTEEEQEKYLAVGRALFAHAFSEEERP